MTKISTPVCLSGNYIAENEPTFDEGGIVSIYSLRNLVSGKVELVLKQYNRSCPNFSKYDLELFTETQLPLSSSDYEKFSLKDKARILKRRQEEIRRYFGEDSKDVIIQSNFFISNDENNETFVYETQKKLNDYVTLGQESEIDISQINNIVLKENILKIKDLLNKILHEKQDSTFKIFIPDFNPHNIAITKDGLIHIFDTNFWGFQWSSFIPYKVEYSIKLLDILLKRLEVNLY